MAPATVTARAGRRPDVFVRALVVIAALAFVVRVLVIVLVDPKVPDLGDASAYHLLANHLADGEGYIRPFDLVKFHVRVPTAEYPPLFPGLLSVAAWLGARSVQAQRLVMAGFGTGTVVLVGLLGRRVGQGVGPRAGRAVGLVAAALAAVYPMLFLAEATLMSETLFAFLVTAALLLAYRALDRPTLLRFALLGVVLGLATLTRAEAMLLAVLLVGAVALLATGLSRPRRLAAAAVGLAVAALVVIPWTARNAARFDAFVPVSNNLGTAIQGANCHPTYNGSQIGLWRFTGVTKDHVDECFTGFNGRNPGFDEATAAADARHAGLQYARDHKWQVPVVMTVRVLRTWTVFKAQQTIDTEALEGRPRGWEEAGTWMFRVLAVAAVAGFVVLVRRRARIAPLVVAVVLVTLSSALTYGNQRFRIAAEPAILVTAAVAVVAAFGWIRARRTGREPAYGGQ